MKISGFTLVELVLTLVIVGILSAVAIPRFFERRDFDEREFFDQTRAMLRYAQKVAIAQNRAVFVRLRADSVALCFDAACASPVAAAAGRNSGSGATVIACGNATWFCEGIPSGLTYTALNAATTPVNYVSAGNATFFFNALGRPFNTGDAPASSTFNQPLTVTVTGSSTAHSFTVEQETGYVH